MVRCMAANSEARPAFSEIVQELQTMFRETWPDLESPVCSFLEYPDLSQPDPEPDVVVEPEYHSTPPSKETSRPASARHSTQFQHPPVASGPRQGSNESLALGTLRISNQWGNPVYTHSGRSSARNSGGQWPNPRHSGSGFSTPRSHPEETTDYTGATQHRRRSVMLQTSPVVRGNSRNFRGGPHGERELGSCQESTSVALRNSNPDHEYGLSPSAPVPVPNHRRAISLTWEDIAPRGERRMSCSSASSRTVPETNYGSMSRQHSTDDVPLTMPPMPPETPDSSFFAAHYGCAPDTLPDQEPPASHYGGVCDPEPASHYGGVTDPEPESHYTAVNPDPEPDVPPTRAPSALQSSPKRGRRNSVTFELQQPAWVLSDDDTVELARRPIPKALGQPAWVLTDDDAVELARRPIPGGLRGSRRGSVDSNKI
eukprot:TRINITY_DN3077_c0_g3_i3.p1 TRINITY_DN3077_c0_g3~~TRINITY_DN3077_c0_g3_i3.p1  ORF type:complete len:428 (+),score=45.44 TRINITY_DN3077_c0_g3_i3:195-1478(+)